MDDPVRVLIAEDEPHLRDSFELLLESDPGCVVTGVAADGVAAALRAGASGFLVKDVPPADLLNAVYIVASGHALFAPGMVADG